MIIFKIFFKIKKDSMNKSELFKKIAKKKLIFLEKLLKK